ncbi:Ig-like domain-containing protein [Paenibacillus sp. TRM 82003]|nr:Ig-like domain-containing protein [Paenibacillus sp. TRM 82003]
MKRFLTKWMVIVMALLPMMTMVQPKPIEAYNSSEVHSTIPYAGQTNVPIDQAITIRFNHPIYTSNNYNGVTLSGGGFHHPAITKSVNGNELTITPTEPLMYGTTYTVTIPYSAVFWISTTPYTNYYQWSSPITYTLTTVEDPALAGGTRVSGGIYEDATWSRENSPYVVAGDITVFQDAVLTIEAGTKVFFKPNMGMTVRGQLYAQGTAEQPIELTGQPVKGSWRGLTVMTNLGGSVNLQGSKASYANQAIYFNNECCGSGERNPSFVTDSTLHSNHTAIGGYMSLDTYYNSRLKVTGTSFVNNGTGVSTSNAEIRSSNFQGSQTAVVGENMRVYDSVFHQNDTALRASGEVLSATVTSNTYGIVPYHMGALNVKMSTVTDNVYGIYRDSYYYYGGGQIHLMKNEIARNEVGIELEYGDTAQFNNIYDNSSYNVFYRNSQANKDLSNNYWGTTNAQQISDRIYDGYDNLNLGLVKFQPMLLSPVSLMDSQAPTWPVGTNLQVSLYDHNDRTRVQLYWPTASDDVGIKEYVIYQNNSILATVSNLNVYTVTGLTYGQTHTFEVEAVDAGGNRSVNNPRATHTVPGQIPVTGISLSSYHIELTVQSPTNSTMLEAFVMPSNASNPNVRWTSSDPTVVSVTYGAESTHGILNAHRVGSTQISATTLEGGYSAYAYVTVTSSTYEPLPDTQPPVWSDGTLFAEDVQSRSVRLHWCGATDHGVLKDYVIFQNDTSIATVSADTYTYKIKGLEPGTTYTFRVEAQDQANNRSVGGPTTTVTTQQEIEVNAYITVLSEDGEPVAGAEVEAIRGNGSTSSRTDDNGVVRLKLRTGEYTLKADADAWTHTSQLTVGNTDPMYSTITLHAGGRITGQVLDVDGTLPKGHMRVYAYDAQGNLVNGTGIDRSGTYSMSFDPGTYVIRARGGDESQEHNVDVSVGETATTDFWIDLTSIYGEVTDLRGQPVRNASIDIEHPNGGGSGLRSDGEGYFGTIIESGTYLMTVSAPGYEDWVKEIEISAREALLQNVVLTPIDSEAPSWPEGATLTAASIDENSVRLTWSPAEDDTGIERYDVYRDNILVGWVQGSEQTFIDSGLTKGQTYLYKVEAIDAKDRSTTDGPTTLYTAGSPTLAMSVDAASVGVNEEVSISLEANEALRLAGFEMALHYDASLFEYVSSSIDEAFGTNGMDAAFFASKGQGKVNFAGTLLGDAAAKTGDVRLMTAKFRSTGSTGKGTFTVMPRSAFSDDLGTLYPMQSTVSQSVYVVVPVSGVVLDKQELYLNSEMHPTETLLATVLPAEASNPSVIWTSSNPLIATVDSNGTVTAVSGGQAIVTATTVEGEFTAQATVFVHVPVQEVRLNKERVVLTKSQTERLVAELLPIGAEIRDVTWSSGNPNIAEVSADGTVTAVAVGTTFITVTTVDGGLTATVPVFVTGTAELEVLGDVGIVHAGERTTVYVNARNAFDLKEFQLLLKFNPSLFELEKVVLNPEFGDDETVTSITYEETGDGHISIQGLGLEQTDADGELGLVEITLKAKMMQGSGDFTLLEGSQWSNSEGVVYSLPNKVQTRVAVASTDVTGDGISAINDLVLVAKSFGKNEGEAGYQTGYDMNRDGVVDIMDIAYVARRVMNKP